MGRQTFSKMESYAVAATDGLIAFRGLKQYEVNDGAGLPKNLLNMLPRGHRAWNLENVEALCNFFDLEPDEFFRIGRIFCNGLPPYPASDELLGTKPGSRERFALLYERAALGTWLPKVYDAKAAAAWSPPAFTAYQKGKLGDDVMFAALADMVRRLETNPGLTPKEIASTFGLLRD